MNFFNIGPLEFVLILILALMIFGPRRLPEIARDLGKAISEFRRASQEITTQIAAELNAEPQAPQEKESPPSNNTEDQASHE